MDLIYLHWILWIEWNLRLEALPIRNGRRFFPDERRFFHSMYFFSLASSVRIPMRMVFSSSRNLKHVPQSVDSVFLFCIRSASDYSTLLWRKEGEKSPFDSISIGKH